MKKEVYSTCNLQYFESILPLNITVLPTCISLLVIVDYVKFILRIDFTRNLCNLRNLF